MTNRASAWGQVLSYEAADDGVDLPEPAQGGGDEIAGEGAIPRLQARESLVSGDGLVEGTMPVEDRDEDIQRNLPSIRQGRAGAGEFAALRAAACGSLLPHPHGP
jgi:hypothetical protein